MQNNSDPKDGNNQHGNTPQPTTPPSEPIPERIVTQPTNTIEQRSYSETSIRANQQSEGKK